MRRSTAIRRPRPRRSPPAWRRRWSAAGCDSRRPSSPRRRRPRRSRCASSSRARARATSALCALQMWAYVATYKMPNDDPEALERRVRVAYPVARRPLPRRAARRRRCGSSARSAARAASTRWEKVLVWSHWLWFAFPHGTVRLPAAAPPRALPARARRGSTRRSTSGVIGYWAIPTAPPWYAARQGLMDDGRTPELRRMMVEYGEHFWGSGWDLAVRCPGRQSPGRHAVAALRHHPSWPRICSPRRAGSPASSAGPTPARSARARLPRRALRRRPRGRPRAGRGHPPRGARCARRCSQRVSAAVAGAGGAGARMTEAAAPDRAGRPGAARGRGRPRGAAGAPAHARATCSRSPASSPPSLAALYFLLPQLAGLDDTWNRIEDGRPVVDRRRAVASPSGCSAATSRCSAASSRARGRAHRLARELPDHDGGARRVAPVRGRRRRRPRAHRVGAAARGHAQARASPTRRSRSSS